jgi:hypothetical protein
MDAAHHTRGLLRSTPATVTSLAVTAATGVAAVVLAGWILDVEPLRTLVPGSNAMVASTAMCFLLTAGALSALARRGKAGSEVWAGRMLALAAALIGILKLGEYALGWDVGLDLTLRAEDPGPFPGQMAIPTAISFMLLGIALSVLDVETRRGQRPAEWLVLTAAAFPILGLIGRLYGVPTLVSLATGTVIMAMPTAVTFLILSAGALAARPDRGLMRLATSPGPAGVLLRRLLPSAALVLVALGWLRILGQQAGLLGNEFGMAVTVFAAVVILALLVWLTAWTFEHHGR